MFDQIEKSDGTQTNLYSFFPRSGNGIEIVFTEKKENELIFGRKVKSMTHDLVLNSIFVLPGYLKNPFPVF